MIFFEILKELFFMSLMEESVRENQSLQVVVFLSFEELGGGEVEKSAVWR